MKRRLLELSLWALAIVVPLAFWQLRTFDTGEKLLVVDGESVALMLEQILFFYAFPSVPFIFVAYLCRRCGANGTPRHQTNSLTAATIGAIIAVGVPYLFLSYSANWQSPIAMGFLITPIPIYSLVMILIGWRIGQVFTRIGLQKTEMAKNGT